MATENTELLNKFLAYLRLERRASENTIYNYQFDLTRFIEWLGTASLATVSRTDVQRYIAETMIAGKSGRTAARRLACLRNFYRFLIDEGDIAHDPTRNIPVAKTWKRVPKALSLADLESMISSLASSKINIRDKAILLTFFGSGLRESELAALKLQDVDLDAGIAKVWSGKGGKDGIVPLSATAVEAIQRYLTEVRPIYQSRMPESPYLFLPRRTGKGRRQNLTRQEIYYRIRDIAKAALGKKVSPHQLRHGFATVLVENGADVRDVQVLMRHSSVDTTQVYIHIDLNFLRRIYYATHPRARIATA